MAPAQGDFRQGDTMLLVDGRDRQYLLVVPEAAQSVPVKGENLSGDILGGLQDGQVFTTPRERRYLVLRPTLEQIVMNMPREAQVIYPKDLALILMWADIAPGQKVIEIGCGHGALTMALLRALGPAGALISWDLRQDHLNRTRKNIALYLGEESLERWQPRQGDPAQEGLEAVEADRLISDVPEPWELAEAVVQGLRPGGVWVAFIPTVLQMSRLIEAINANKGLCLPEGFEAMQRFWHVKPPSVRPRHQMKAHTGFVVTCRRRHEISPDSNERPALA
ncbi:MAG: hypothetical protein PVG60_03175 [Desulfarculaceae bacterium]